MINRDSIVQIDPDLILVILVIREFRMFAGNLSIIIEFCLALFVVTFFSQSGEAYSVAKYGEFSLDKEGYIKACLTAFAVSREIGRYSTERVGNELSNDGEKLWRFINLNYPAGMIGCSNECVYPLIPTVYAATDYGGRALDDSQCSRLGKFTRLCHLMDLESHYGTERMVAIKNFVCGTKVNILSFNESNEIYCRRESLESGLKEADESFDTVVELTREQLPEEIRKIDTELREFAIKKQEHDKRIRKIAFKTIKEDIERSYLPYRQCWLHREKQQSEPERPKKGVFSRLIQCFGSDCQE